MPLDVNVVGTVEAFSTVAVRAQVTGELKDVNFQQGDDVQAGQVLFTLDHRPLEAALNQAEANLARDTAQAANAKVIAQRMEDLVERGVGTREQRDTARTTAAALDAVVGANRAAVENAKVQLQYATIRAPIAGRTGALMVHAGNLVRANDQLPLVVINQVSPIYVSFGVPEALLPDLRRYMAMRELEVEALPPNEEIAPATGRITFVDNQVDQTTGTIRIKATFPNSNRRLWPGQFVNVRVRLTSDPRAIVVPSVAVQAGPEGQYVYVVKDDQTVEMRPVVVARTAGAETVLKEGVKPGETVVTDGQLRLVPGSRISIKGGQHREGRLMNLSALFIKRPITTTLITLGIVVFGVMSYRVLPVADLPAIDFPTISVNASLPGASPETMASAVALPLEKQFSTISGLTSMNSTNMQGSTSITLQFDLSRDIDAAAQDVQTMIARATRQLPPQMPSPPSYMKVNPGDYPVMLLVMRSPTLPLSTVNEYAESNVSQRISMVNGVAQVNVFGPQKYAVRIDVDPRKLSAHGIGIDEVVTAIQASNVNLPTGTMAGRDRIFTVLADGQLLNAASYAPMVIAYRNGNPVRLGDVARVYDGVEQDKTASWYQGVRNISLMIQKQPGSNVVQVVDDIKELLPVCPRTAAAVGAARRQNGSVGVDSRIGPRREAHAAASRSASSSPSSSCSCAASPRPSSRA